MPPRRVPRPRLLRRRAHRVGGAGIGHGRAVLAAGQPGSTASIDRYGQIREIVEELLSIFTSMVSTSVGSLGGARWMVLICDSSSSRSKRTSTSSSQTIDSCSSSVP